MSRSPQALGKALVGSLGLMLFAGCAPSQVPFHVVFPSVESFLLTTTLRVRVFDGRETTCANLVATAAGGTGIVTTELWARDEIRPCALRSGITISDPGPGERLFLVEGSGADSSTPILIGCSQEQVYGGAMINVNLSTTDRYQDAFMAHPPPTLTADAFCSMAGGV